MLYQTVLLATVAASASASVQETPLENIKMMFDQFKTDFQKKYSSMEEESRFQNFVQTVRTIRERNAADKAKGGSAMHGITKFADLSADEFKQRYLTYTPLTGAERSNATAAKVPQYEGSDSLVDWAGVYTTPVKAGLSPPLSRSSPRPCVSCRRLSPFPPSSWWSATRPPWDATVVFRSVLTTT